METLTSASALPHAIFPRAPSSDKVSSREIDELDKPPLLRETDEKCILFINSSLLFPPILHLDLVRIL